MDAVASRIGPDAATLASLPLPLAHRKRHGPTANGAFKHDHVPQDEETNCRATVRGEMCVISCPQHSALAPPSAKTQKRVGGDVALRTLLPLPNRRCSTADCTAACVSCHAR
jgi:hypothetical protein